MNIDCKVPAANIAVTEHAETKAEPEALPDVFRAERKTPHDLRIRCEHRRERQHEQRLARRQPSTGVFSFLRYAVWYTSKVIRSMYVVHTYFAPRAIQYQ